MNILNSRTLLAVLFAASGAVFLSCGGKKALTATESFNSVIPKPQSSNADGAGVFIIDNDIAISADEENGAHLAAAIKEETGIEPGVGENGKIIAALDGDASLGTEGYDLTITSDNVKISANQPAGIFYGVQTLKQLITRNDSENQWEIATGSVHDVPYYEWRGSMLDVARHFFSVEDVKKYIDLIASYKMNRLHLSLTNDQGWRIEIKSWPNLANHGGKTQVGGGGGGFYTQEQYKELVAYAADRHMIIVPEVDMPGHTNAALASYPNLNCDGKPRELYEGIEVGFSTLCLEKDSTWLFVNDVIRELSEITSGPYIHVGGDEAAATKKEDYIEFVKRFREIVRKNNKVMVGWEETAQSDIDSGVVIQYWHSAEHVNTAVSKGAKVILSPAEKVYLDMQYDSTTRIGLHWAAYIEVDEAYTWKPETKVPGLSREKTLGIETPLWGETVKNMDDVEYLAFPRLPGIAELAWSSPEGRSWDEYKVRLGNHGPRMEKKNIDFYRSKRVEWR
jgi:hexosaminidase